MGLAFLLRGGEVRAFLGEAGCGEGAVVGCTLTPGSRLRRTRAEVWCVGSRACGPQEWLYAERWAQVQVGLPVSAGASLQLRLPW